MRAIGAEFLKVFTTRMWWVLAIVLVAYVALVSGGLGAFFGWYTSNPDAVPGGAGDVPPAAALPELLYGFATTVGYVFPVLLGALAVTAEFRHRTLTPTFLANPHRSAVLWAKLGVLFVLGGLYGVLAFAASIGAGGGALAGFGVENALGDTDTWLLAARGVLAMAIWGAIGVGLGALVPNQVAAIVIVIAFTQFIEPLLRLVASLNDVTAQIGRYLPGAASDALVGASFFSAAGGLAGAAAPLEWWQGGLVLAAYAIVFTVIGHFTSWRRDVS